MSRAQGAPPPSPATSAASSSSSRSCSPSRISAQSSTTPSASPCPSTCGLLPSALPTEPSPSAPRSPSSESSAEPAAQPQHPGAPMPLRAMVRSRGVRTGVFDHVNARLGVPFNAMMLGMVVQILLGPIYPGLPRGFRHFCRFRRDVLDAELCHAGVRIILPESTGARRSGLPLRDAGCIRKRRLHR